MLRTVLLHTCAFVLGLLQVPACGDAVSCTDKAATASCCCFEFDDSEPPGELVNNCGAPEPCGQLRGECPADDATHASCAPTDDAALACILDALQAGAPAQVRWLTAPVFALEDEVYLDERKTTVYVSGDGSAFSTGSRNTGFTFVHEPVARHDVATLGLGECAALPDAQARFDCLRAAFTAAPAETCIDPGP